LQFNGARRHLGHELRRAQAAAEEEDIVLSALSVNDFGSFDRYDARPRFRQGQVGCLGQLGSENRLQAVAGSLLLAVTLLAPAPARALGHCISQAFYDGGWHFYDGDMHSVYLLRDNETVAGEQDLVRDHDLIKRTHSKGILMPDTWWDGPDMCAMYFYEGPVTGERGGKPEATMNMVLRPGEALEWRWGHESPVKYYGDMTGYPPIAPDTIYDASGKYAPEF
jgi:hypothetical protein